jgi:mRNA interferase MazF
VQSDLFNETHASVTVVPVTTMLVEAPLFRVELPSGRATGLRSRSHAMVDKITSVPRERIGSRIGAVAPRELERIDSALRLWVSLS